MSDKDKKPLAGFDVLADFIVGKDPSKSSLGNEGDDTYQDIDPDELEKKINGDDSDVDDTDKDKKPVDKKDNLDVNKKDDDTDDKKNVDTKDKKNDDNKDDLSDEDKEYESEISTFFGSELVKKLGLDIDESDLKFEKIDEVLELMKEIVAENSKPVYASDEVEAFDEFVRNGGSLRNFYNDVYSGKLDPSSVDLEKEYDQRAVIRENLLNQGYKEEKIKRMIARYEESETLKEEAEDALELVTEFNQKKADSLLVKQKKEAEELVKAQQKFYSDVNSTIKNISDIGGFPLTEKEKRELLQYAFTPDSDGLTKYQKELRGDVLNILESAYFTMTKKHRNMGNVSKRENTDAYKTLRDKLKAKGNKQIDDDNLKGKKTGSSSLGDFGRGIIFK